MAPEEQEPEQVIALLTIDEALEAVDAREAARRPISGINGCIFDQTGQLPLADEILDLSEIYDSAPMRTWSAARTYLQDASRRFEDEPRFRVEIFGGESEESAERF